jgi:hypothetical protein
MAILATLFGLLGRFAGKLLTMTLGWAGTLLFGRVPKDRQVLLAAITFGALIWAVVVFGVIWPDAGTFILAFIPIPPWIEEDWVRLGMIVGALGIPLALSAATLRLLQPEDRPEGPAALVGHFLRGYPLAAAMAAMIAFLAAIGIVRKLSSLTRRWTDAHIPIVAKPGHYEELAHDLDKAISDAGIDVTARPAPSVLVLPGRLLASIASTHVRGLLPDKLVRLVGRDLEVLIYPSDVAIAGTKVMVARVQAALASRLTTAQAWLTATAEGQRIEDRLARIVRERPTGGERVAAFEWLDRQLAIEDLPYEEWEVLYRERLQVERDLLLGNEPGEDMPVTSGTHAPGRQARRVWSLLRGDGQSRDLLGIGISAASLTMLLVDVVLLMRGRGESSTGSSIQAPRLAGLL